MAKPKASPQMRAKALILLRQKQAAGITGGYADFKKRYWHRPDLFAIECIDWPKGQFLAAYQEQGMQKLAEKRRLSLRSLHGAGKTAFCAIVVLWFSLTRDGLDWKCPTLASSWRQVEKYLWPEIHKWSRKIRWDKVGRPPFNQNELMNLTLKLDTGQAFAMASSDAELIEGAHADHVLYLFDESKSIPPAIWDAAEGAFSTGDCYWLSASTPGDPIGRFYDIQVRKPGYEDWEAYHVTLEMAVGAGRVDKKWANARKRQWGEESAVYQNRVLGEFASSNEDSVIPLSWIERAQERWKVREDSGDWGPLTRISADIGRGGDPNVLARRHNFSIRSFEESNEKTIMPVTGRIKGILDGEKEKGNKKVDAVIDVNGIGSGVVDRLREFPEYEGKILAFVAQGKTAAKDKTGEFGFANERSHCWWVVRELLQDDIIDLPDNDTMVGDLTAPRYKVLSGGRIQVESKGDYQEDGQTKKGVNARLGRSTNYGDVVIQAFWDKIFEPSDEEIAAYANYSGEKEVAVLVPQDVAKYIEAIKEMERQAENQTLPVWKKIPDVVIKEEEEDAIR